ncbi:MAG: hypothetical protein ACI9UO_003056, partial [Nitrospinales bacterium]
RGFACIKSPGFERYSTTFGNFTTLKTHLHPLYMGSIEFFRDDQVIG